MKYNSKRREYIIYNDMIILQSIREIHVKYYINNYIDISQILYDVSQIN